MFRTSHSPHSAQQQRICEFGVESAEAPSQNLHEETLNPLDPSSIPGPYPITDALGEYAEEGDGPGGEGEEPEEDGQEQEAPQMQTIPSGKHLHIVPSVTDPNLPFYDVALASPSLFGNPKRGGNKRKKGKTHIKRQQSIQRKFQSLMAKLNPIPFIPPKILDFPKHEDLLKKLGLWDFVHIDFDRNIRGDLLAQLIATYDPKLKYGYVNGFRIMVNRADFAHAFKLPVKKKASGIEGVDLDREVVGDSIGFILDFVSDWVLLHDDTWMMPSEVLQWFNLIKEGHPEKVDWAGLFRFMVEKELMQGDQLGDCYYASHLQYLMKFKRGEAFFTEDEVTEKVDLEVETKEESEDANEEETIIGGGDDDLGEEACLMERLNVDLTLGQEGGEEESVLDVGMVDAEKEENDFCSGVGGDEDEDEDEAEEDGGVGREDDDEDEEEVVAEEQVGWFLHGKNDLGEHFLQPCSVEDVQGFGSLVSRREEEDGEEEEEEIEGNEGDNEERQFDVFPTDDDLHDEGITGDFLQGMETNQASFNPQEQLSGSSPMDIRDDIQHMASSPSFFSHVGKRVMVHDDDTSRHPLSDSNKRLRINDSWNQKPVNFGMCMEQIQQMADRASMLYGEKDQELEQLNMNQQILLTELRKRDTVIDHLHKTKLEEMQKKDGEIYRLEQEVFFMGSVLDGYRKTLKETQKTFAEYRQRFQLHEEPTYKDAGPGGIMLSTTEIEKINEKREEYKMNCLAAEQIIKEAYETYSCQFNEFFDKISSLSTKLEKLEAEAKNLVQMYAEQKIPAAEEKDSEVAEGTITLSVPQGN